MGEHKQPKPAHPRPNIEIIRLKQTVTAARGETLDPDTAGYMRDLEAAMAWIDKLEADRMAEITPGFPRILVRVDLRPDHSVQTIIPARSLTQLLPTGWAELEKARTLDLLREANARLDQKGT